MKGIRSYLIVAVIGVLLAIFIGYRIYNQPHRNIAREKTAFNMTADDLFDEYELNEVEADLKFLDQVIEVTGTVEEIAQNSDGYEVITLTAANAMLGGISATLSADPGSNPVEIVTGDQVILKCRCTGKLLDVVLVDCSHVNIDG